MADSQPLPTRPTPAGDADVIELGEWETSDRHVTLTAADRALLESEVNSDKTRLHVHYDEDGQAYFEARQFVGLIALPDGPTIQITPKAAGGNLLHLLRYSQGVDSQPIEETASLKSSGSFVDALAALLTRELTALRRRGLHKEYRRQQEAREHLRGRLHVHRQLQRQEPVATRFESDYDALTTDTIANQAILYATTRLAQLVTDPDLQADLEWHQSWLQQQITLTEIQPGDVERVELSRLNDDYADILQLIKPVLEGRFVENLTVGTQAAFSLLVNMNTVFEQVVERAVTDLAAEHTNWSAAGQVRTTNLIHGTPQVRMYPDFLITQDDTPLIVGDAKWKTGSPKNADIYQLVAYTLAHDTPGLLVYPAQNGSVTTTYEVDNQYPLHLIELPTNYNADTYTDFTTNLTDTLHTAIQSAKSTVNG
ncbi:McrC family protein [Halarchaeum sp. P4]|uniref:McrC family protein n=1 Tax=Halarchaeum sp. P4 TaxID=3421639 RepID=UPI003EC0D03C